MRKKIIIPISNFNGSKYADIEILQYIPKKNNESNMYSAVVDFKVRKLISANTIKELADMIRNEIKNNPLEEVNK